MLGYLSADIICVEKQTVFFEVQIKSKQKYPSIFSHQMEAIVFSILSMFFSQHPQFWGISESYALVLAKTSSVT